jgi:predicted GNAT family acetyltransferase
MQEWLEQLNRHEAHYCTFAGEITYTPYAWFLRGDSLVDYRDANHAMHLRDDGRGAEAVAKAVIEYYQTLGRRVVADLDAIAEQQGIGVELRKRGVLPAWGTTLLMEYTQQSPPNVDAERVEVERIAKTDLRLETWLRLFVEDEVPEELAMWEGVGRKEAEADFTHLYLGLYQGEVVGICTLASMLGWGRVDSVYTLPSARRKRVASAMVAEAVNDSLQFGNGYTYLYTEQGGAGEQVYRRLGFQAVARNPLRRHFGMAF